jgi:hypothetical protein
MAVADQGFTVVDLPPISPAVLDSFHGCATVERSGTVTWYHRALRFRLTWTADDDWFYELAGVRAERRGSVVRYRDIDFTYLLRAALGHMWLDVSADWLIELNQIRTEVTVGGSGPVLPPGRRTGGAEVTMIAVARRHGLAVGGVRLYAPGQPGTCRQAGIAPGQAMLITRPDLTYALGAAHAVDDSGGLQDTLVITVSPAVPRSVSQSVSQSVQRSVSRSVAHRTTSGGLRAA